MRCLVLLALLTTACRTATPPGHGALAIEVTPNPIVAKSLGGTTYSLPFDLVLRETGGRRVDIGRISLDVVALGALHVMSEQRDAAQLRAAGFPTTIPPHGELRYHFEPQKNVSDERMFGAVSARLTVEAKDADGFPATAGTTVTMRR